MSGRAMTDAEAVREFLLAGNATVTLLSRGTGVWYTYRLRRGGDGRRPWFVSLLTGPEEYTYIGMLVSGGKPEIILTRAARLGQDSRPVAAFNYFFKWVVAGRLAPGLEVRHEGRCGRCGRELTVPESIDRGIGPDCWEMMHREK